MAATPCRLQLTVLTGALMALLCMIGVATTPVTLAEAPAAAATTVPPEPADMQPLAGMAIHGSGA